MKKHLISFLMAALFVFALHSAAFADVEILYVQQDGTKAFEEPDTNSRVLWNFNAADKILVEAKSGSFVGVLVEDLEYGGQLTAWIPANRLGPMIPQSRCPHDWGDWETFSDPSCTDPGYSRRYCSLCGMLEERETPALGHQWGQPRVDRQPTCTSEGVESTTCTRCGATKAVDIPRIDHSFGNWTVSRNATCTAEGAEVRRCSVCGYEETRTIAMLPHTFGEWKVTKEATCTETGERTHTCSVCNFIENETIEMLPHQFELKVIKETTDHSSGIRCQICKVCGFKTDEEEFDPEGTLRRGDSGEEVQKMQQLLIDQEFLAEGGADGKFGSGTENALMEFQLSQHLTPDGIGWPQTLKRLNHEFGPWRITKPVSRYEAGERSRVCKDCGYEQKQPLEAEPSYVRRESGDDVAAMQKMITAVGYDAGDPDGVFGKLLNEAFTNLGREKGFVFTEDKITAANVDALVNAWIGSVSPADMKGEGRVNDPVSLALTVREVMSLEDTYEEGENGMVTYQWTLKNLGSADCHIYGVLLNYGETPDFGTDNIVLDLCGQQLKAEGANTATGTFTVPTGGYAPAPAVLPEEAQTEEPEEAPAQEALTEEPEEAAAQEALTEEPEEAPIQEALTEEAAGEEAPAEKGPMNFCAIVAEDNADAVWCSNVITVE